MRKDMKKGFTIVETMLAMAFVGLLLVAIAVLVRNVGETYAKGITVKNVNESARNIIDDLSRSIAASPTFGSMDVRSNGYDETGARGCLSEAGGFIPESDPRFPADCNIGYGVDAFNFNATAYYNHSRRRFCTGLVSYVWNLHPSVVAAQAAAGIGSTDPNWIDPRGIDNNEINTWNGNAVRLVKVVDFNRDYCALDAGDPSGLRRPHIRDRDSPVELINAAEENLILYNFVVFEIEEGQNINRINGQVFYSGSFVLGTMGGVQLTGMNPECTVPSEAVEMQEYYCSVNKFNFSQRAMGSSQ
ncbi:hypothetical protein FWH09_02125 [Candidatus Saccharibacteria bacterium]|nr:hypothetical protein [Candidatus Saccharibacteria bacterium]